MNLALLFGACCIGIALLLWVTPKGIGLYYDSMTYFESAENLLAGLGLGRVACEAFKPLTRHPPLYSLLLAALNASGVALPIAGRLVSGLALGLTSVLAGASVWRGTRSRLLMLLALVWVLVSAPVLNVFSWAMSEPLYVVLSLAALLAIDALLASPGPRVVLVAAGLAALAFLTRYVGVLLILGCGLLLAREAARHRFSWRDLGIFFVIACAPMAIWLARCLAVAGNATGGRTLAYNPPERGLLRQGADTVIGWFVPAEALHSEESAATVLLAIALIVTLVYVALRSRRLGNAAGTGLADLHVATSLAYLAGVLGSIMLFDSTTPLDDRILIPTYISLGIVLLILAGQGMRARLVLPAIVALVAFLVLAVRQVGQLGDALVRLRADGQGYAAARWVQSEVASRLEELDPTTIYTNDLTAVYFVSHDHACGIPTQYAEDDLTRMRDRLQEKGSVLAIFGLVSSEFMPLERLTDGLSVVETLADGSLYIGGMDAAP
ncbi:MAG: hypothetical protein NTU91_12080 [Chloroflexi bacterium]|nr:hypothetical protein [Chloroflexota bacterium]